MKTEKLRAILAWAGHQAAFRKEDDSMKDVMSAMAELMTLEKSQFLNETSLRDTFAAAALTGILAAPKYAQHTPDDAAERCYRYADSMLAAREGK